MPTAREHRHASIDQRRADGDVSLSQRRRPQLQLVGTIARKTTLSGSVSHVRGSAPDAATPHCRRSWRSHPTQVPSIRVQADQLGRSSKAERGEVNSGDAVGDDGRSSIPQEASASRGDFNQHRNVSMGLEELICKANSSNPGLDRTGNTQALPGRRDTISFLIKDEHVARDADHGISSEIVMQALDQVHHVIAVDRGLAMDFPSLRRIVDLRRAGQR